MKCYRKPLTAKKPLLCDESCISQKTKDGVTYTYISVSNKEEMFDPDDAARIVIDMPEIEGWNSIYLMWEGFWCVPEFGKEIKDIPRYTQGLLYKKTDGLWGVIIPVCDREYKCYLEANEKYGLFARIFSWKEGLTECSAFAYVSAEGENPYKLYEKCMRAALTELGDGYPMRDGRKYPELFEYLGWCSWDAMPILVYADGIIEKCREFRDKNIPVKWAIFDDMWADVPVYAGIKKREDIPAYDSGALRTIQSFDAAKDRFPNGLKDCIDKVKEFGMKVGMWHPISGYWDGIEKGSPLYDELKDIMRETETGSIIHKADEESAYRFNNAYHTYLEKCGADFVKVDNQSTVRENFGNTLPVGEVTRNMHRGLERSVKEHFGGTIINCMCNANENMFSRPYSAVTRCSGDFQPEDKEWFSHHITQCAFNGLLQGQMYYNDWDMWWTDDGQGIKNSVLRAISGGPVYVSDKIGRSRKEVLDPLCLSDGRILRCDRPAMPAEDCLLTDATKNDILFKVQNVTGEYGVLAVFNITDENHPVTGTVSPSDVPELDGDEYVLFDYFTREITFLKKDEKKEITLPDDEKFTLFVIAPVKDGFAPLGLINKYVSPKTIVSVNGEEVKTAEGGTYACVRNGKLYTEERK